MAPLIERRRFTIDEYHRMQDAGILREDDRVELVAGEIVAMSPVGSRHAACVRRLVHMLEQQLGARAMVDSQNPIHIEPDAEPQPDVAVLRPRPDFYERDHPAVADILLVIEVADTSLAYDRQVKLPLYAGAGIPEAWLIDLARESVERHSLPGGQGYGQVARAGREQALPSTVLPDVVLQVDSLLG
jgi:Uma2 family endonuclease